MKKMRLWLPLMACVWLLTACKIELNGVGNKIEPSKNIVKNEYKMPAFDEMDVDVVANVKFVQSSGETKVVLSCPDNYVELFRFEVEKGNELEVGFVRDNVNIDPQHVDITVYAPSLKKLDNSGVASVEVDRLTGDRLEVENSGVGGVYLSGLQFSDIEAECSGVGSIEIGGMANHANLECSGVGSIKAGQLKAKSVKAEVSGVGGIDCYASESIEGEVSGVGSLKFAGKPQNKQLNRSGIGDISEI